ncbi:ABC transporter permease [Halorussus caseinilyticus]|uniref:ABC transporter permease n=1 Tax=Halorussus caseinilyticus TaxID=3034025 RepID=A0ABD5WI74_9EURY|nr:ABC transporter permease [Halorussus sp. DT72]
MNDTHWFLLKRVAWTAFAAYLILSGAFFVFAYTPDPNEALVSFAAADPSDPANMSEDSKQAVAAYEQARNYDEPVFQRYADWMVGYATLDWGRSVTTGGPVTDALADRIPVTLAYLVPAVVVSTLLGVGVGLVSAMRPNGVVDRVSAALSYVGLGVPGFVLGELLLVASILHFSWYRAYYDPRYGLWTAENLVSLALPAFVVALNLLAAQARYARAESREYLLAEFVKTLRASGADARTIGRHVLRNAALPLLTVFFAELLTVLFLTVYVVEVVFRVPGVGQLAYQAIEQRDIGLILATTLLPAFVALLGNLFQDFAYTLLDPRVGDET